METRLKNTLNIIGLNLDTREHYNVTIKGSNAYTLGYRFQKLDLKPIHIEEWSFNCVGARAGGFGRNAGADLYEVMEEITGMNLG